MSKCTCLALSSLDNRRQSDMWEPLFVICCFLYRTWGRANWFRSRGLRSCHKSRNQSWINLLTMIQSASHTWVSIPCILLLVIYRLLAVHIITNHHYYCSPASWLWHRRLMQHTSRMLRGSGSKVQKRDHNACLHIRRMREYAYVAYVVYSIGWAPVEKLIHVQERHLSLPRKQQIVGSVSLIT